MRLLTKTTLYFLAALIPILVAAGFFLYNRFSTSLNKHLDQELITEEVQWVRYLREQARRGATFILQTPEIIITPVDAPVTKYPTIETTTGYNAEDNRRLPFRQLSHVVSIYGTPYLITVRRSLEQRVVFVSNITRIMLIVFLTLFVTTLIINWLISRTVWTPFKRSLRKISNAELQKLHEVHFEETNIKEFNDLNDALNQMAAKIHKDYVSIKEFTENAAHEMQTPVAVVQSKLELMLQDPQLKDEQANAIIQASEALSRLSKLNQSLLLLAKIENHQYETSETISFTEVVKKYLKLLDELIKDKSLAVETKFEADWLLNLHPFLADTLVSNLLGNAIKYNYNGGRIIISVSNKNLSISNTSHLATIDKDQLFKRFNKSSSKTGKSNGLGLAIVKGICDTHNLKINYEQQDGMHYFKIEPK